MINGQWVNDGMNRDALRLGGKRIHELPGRQLSAQRVV